MNRVVKCFINAINDHDIDRIASLMSNDHIFIDAHGREVIGRDNMKNGWIAYFKWFPDYHIDMADVFEKSNTVFLTGFVQGSYMNSTDTDDHWRLPAAWRAVIQNDRIALWQVFADTKIPFEIIQRHSAFE
ncbi:nuclear transport factor 2 family protein [bacterium]|nr:nuclear transport factor 2 family protein [bacterium]